MSEQRRLRRLCVFCGANTGLRPAYADAAVTLAGLLAERGIELVYGGGSVGLMGCLADAVLARGGRVTGVIPRTLFRREAVHEGLTELVVVDSMLERKTVMIERADAFAALPGGFGTIDELFEVLTWSQLGMHAKPCGLLDIEGFYGGLLAFLDHQVREGFLRPGHRALVHVEATPEALLARLDAFGARGSDAA